MIIVDTNVISEPLRVSGDPAVALWLDKQAIETLFITSVNLAELFSGIAKLPDGKRREKIANALDELLNDVFGPRILPFDAEAAKAYASLSSEAQRKGIAVSFADGQIAAIAKVRGFMVATRDASPFMAAGVTVINPWVE